MRFSLPLTSDANRVTLAIFGEKFRNVRFRLKAQVLKEAKQKLDEVYNVDKNVQPRDYNNEELLQALDMVQPPIAFADHQWELFKNYLRSPKAKKLSLHGKKARSHQIHTHTTGRVSYARKRDEFKLKNKRQPNDVEFFAITHQKKKGSYVDERSKQFVDLVTQTIKEKMTQIGDPEMIDPGKKFEIEREVMQQYMGPNMPGRARGYGVGVRKSQVSLENEELRRMGAEGSTSSNQVHILLARLNSQEKQIKLQDEKLRMANEQLKRANERIESQEENIKIMQKKMDDMMAQSQMVLSIFGSVDPHTQVLSRASNDDGDTIFHGNMRTRTTSI